MRSLVCVASIGVVAFALAAHAQEKKQPPKAEVVKATYLVKGLH